MFQVLQSMARDAPSASVSEVQIHYKADPLPITPEETLACLPHNQALPPQRIVSILQRFVVKAGSSSVAAEAQNMLLVQKHTTIPVPAVYLVFSQGPWTYLVMQQISGQNADIAWPDLDAEDRAAVFSQLAGYVDQLRAIPPPQDLSPGPPGGGRCEGRYFSFYGAGPFKTADDLVAWMNYKLAAGSHPSSSLFVPDPTLVFTHQDIALRNLILESDVQSGRTRVWLIDWEQAAWLPPYFEGASAVTETGAQGWVPISWTEGMKEIFGVPDFTREWDLLERLRGVLSASPF
ncbi:hypothetical protein EXIGLDRAFT_683216 [Exidia glandulosa HHB12029]|uniref:Aminoglycoside phosphotransferase domain-containing protein n=1 Tax=Exidia glandulosa HHB12029 TaxID=1314781 RepID=A0A165ZMF8_EXIGL|nr:hypothetical protein EXIGLDRAFT_683216 [Exidia glandulosa HHB12029]